MLKQSMYPDGIAAYPLSPANYFQSMEKFAGRPVKQRLRAFASEKVIRSTGLSRLFNRATIRPYKMQRTNAAFSFFEPKLQ
jgi:hypothetical protein